MKTATLLLLTCFSLTSSCLLACQSAPPPSEPPRAASQPAPEPPPAPPRDLLDRAVDAIGGADALAGVRTLAIKGTVTEWEPEQSLVADGEPRLASESTFEVTSDVGGGATRVDWVRKFAYPQPRTYAFSEIVTPQAGYVAGIDTTA